MFKLLTFWPAWRAIRRIAVVVTIVSLLTLLFHERLGGAGYGQGSLNELRHAVHPIEQQLEHSIERALER